MQTPVRFYITRSDDQAVVHTVPVAIRHPVPTLPSVPTVETPVRAANESASREVAPSAPRRAKLTQLVRSAAHPTKSIRRASTER